MTQNSDGLNSYTVTVKGVLAECHTDAEQAVRDALTDLEGDYTNVSAVQEDSPRIECAGCGKPVSRDPYLPPSQAPWVDSSGDECCEINYDDCSACQDGESHPHWVAEEKSLFAASNELPPVDPQVQAQITAASYLIQAQQAGLIGDDDWQASTDGAYFLVNFGDGRGVVEYTAAEIVTKLAPDGGFFNRP